MSEQSQHPQDEMTMDQADNTEDRCIRAATDSRILILTLDNPPNNTLPARFFRELHHWFQQAEGQEIRAVVVTGQGRSFSKGADLAELNGASPMLEETAVVQANRVFDLIARFPKPVVAAINGACFGGGLELALACHLRVCSEKALLGLPEVSIGLIPGLGGISRLASVIGRAKALEMILLGDMIAAPMALELNLVSRIFPRKDFMIQVLNFVRIVLSAPPAAVSAVIELFRIIDDPDSERFAQASAEAFCRLARSRVMTS